MDFTDRGTDDGTDYGKDDRWKWLGRMWGGGVGQLQIELLVIGVLQDKKNPFSNPSLIHEYECLLWRCRGYRPDH